MSSAPAIGLCMIVKDEAPVIERCLRSVRPLIDYVLIEDTGSTDGTQDIIRAYLAAEGLPGEVFEEPWHNFAENRSLALERLRQQENIDYALIMDADDVAVLADGFDPQRFRLSLNKDLYHVELHRGASRYWRPQIVSNRKQFCYRGVLHEFIEVPPEGSTAGELADFYIVTGVEGNRSRNPDKYRDDASLLERVLQTEQDPFLVSRYTFYMAQSWRDAGEPEKALIGYLRRAELGYWAEERFVSLLSAARLQEQLGYPADEVIERYLEAGRICPHRAEALHGAMRYCRVHGLNRRGFALGNQHDLRSFKPEGLFVEMWIYDYGLLDEYAINAYWAEGYTECVDACLKLLAGGKLPASERPRVIENANFAVGKLPRVPDLGSVGAESLFDQHPLEKPRRLRSRLSGSPRVLLAVLAKQKADELPLYLDCIEALDYPKSSIVLYIRTNNNTDQTENILREWVARVGQHYAHVEFDATDVVDSVEQFGVHEWNSVRFRVLARIRNISLRKAIDHGCDFYFTADVDNFIRPCTLRELVALDLPIVAPFLRSVNPGAYYSNYHSEIDENGYYKSNDQYQWVLNRYVRGLIEMPVVHCTYLVRADVIPDLTYEDASQRHEYVVFSESARQASIPQYFDNRQIYGYITFARDDPNYHIEGGIERARALLAGELESGLGAQVSNALTILTPDYGPEPGQVTDGANVDPSVDLRREPIRADAG